METIKQRSEKAWEAQLVIIKEVYGPSWELHLIPQGVMLYGTIYKGLGFFDCVELGWYNRKERIGAVFMPSHSEQISIIQTRTLEEHLAHSTSSIIERDQLDDGGKLAGD